MIERCILLGKPPVEHWAELQGDEPIHQDDEQNKNDDASRNKEGECTCMPILDTYPEKWTLKEVEKITHHHCRGSS